MRPRSITGPILLVLIGIVFLLNNLGRSAPIWSLAWDYWPVLLIGLGVIGLVEVLYHVGRGGSAPPRPLATGASSGSSSRSASSAGPRIVETFISGPSPMAASTFLARNTNTT